jgi:hypothetical protein
LTSARSWPSLAAMVALGALGVVVVFTQRLIREGHAAILRSDACFHGGDIPCAIREARSARMAFVPGAPHYERAMERLVSLARGSEAEGQFAVARLAWSALRDSEVRTDYPGRGPVPALELAEQGLRRVDRELEQRP